MMSDWYTPTISRFADRSLATIACGTTCAYLGDERNLREFLVADETARRLRDAGTTVIFYLIDDSLDPLTIRQLRVAVNKDPELLARYRHWCGKPIAMLPDPWECCESYAAHFEKELLRRLHHLDCHPLLVSTARLYERGVYAPYVRFVLKHSEEILQFLHERCGAYRPAKLFWVICPECGYIDETSILHVERQGILCRCARCDNVMRIAFDELRGKLNWKLDCAARWVILNIDAEAFGKAFLGSQRSTFAIAQALNREFFAGREIQPLYYGPIKLEDGLSMKLLDSLPRDLLRHILVAHPSADLHVTRALVMTAASRFKVLPEMSYLDVIRQLLPIWILTPDALTHEQRELVTCGIAFKQHFLNTQVRLHLPQREHFDGEQPHVLAAVHQLLNGIIALRVAGDNTWEKFQAQALQMIDALGTHRAAVLRRLRHIIGQEQGPPAVRILFNLPLDYLQMLAYVLELHLGSRTVAPADSASLSEFARG